MRPFIRFSLLAYLLMLFYLLICGFEHLGRTAALPFFYQALLLIIFAAILIFLWLSASLIIKIKSHLLQKHRKWLHLLEAVLVLCVLCVSAALRWRVIASLPMEPQSDFRTFYEIAQLLNSDTLITQGPGYCDYAAIFPHIMGYSTALAAVLRPFGNGVLTGQIFGLVLSLLSCVAAYRTARLIAGRVAGLTALALCAFFPSAILFGNMLSSETLFTCLMLLCIWLFTWLFVRVRAQVRHPWLYLLLYALLGMLLAAAAAVRPLSLVLTAAMLLCLLPVRLRLPAGVRKEQPVSLRALSRGWVRCAFLLAAYLLTSAILTTRVELAIDRKPAGLGAALGYNLMVGLNVESKGLWNETDSNYLYDALAESGNASDAQRACREVALQRLKAPAPQLLNLFAEKFSALWSNDDFGITWNHLFLAQQNQLTEGREALLNRLLPTGNFFYLSTVFLCLLGGLRLWRRESLPQAMLVLFLLGTAALHLFVEVQNRYHYHILPVLAVLSGCAVAGIVSEKKHLLQHQTQAGEMQALREATYAELTREIERVQQELREQRRNALQGVFDIGAAIREGHVRVTASQEYMEKGEEDAPD